MIRFEKVTPDNFEGVISLKLRDDQVGFLESNLYSLAESKVFDYLEPRAIYDDDRLIGFMLYYFRPDGVMRQMGPGEGKHEIHSGGRDYVYFKRLMLDESEQGKGLGKASLLAAIDYFKEEYPTAAFVELMHYLDNDTGAWLYEAVGFESTGEVRRTLRPGTEDEYDEELVRRRYYETC